MASINMDIILRLKRLPDLLSNNKKVLDKVGLTYATLVRERTVQGSDIDEVSFRPYSPGYAHLRSKLGLPTDVVNLTRSKASPPTEGMLASVTHVIDADLSTVTAYIADPRLAQIGYYHAVSGAGRSRVIRKWWGLTRPQKKEMLEILNVDVDKIINEKL